MAATHIAERQIVVAGDQNVDATGINDHGRMVATVYAGITLAPSGVEIDGDTMTILPAPYPGSGPPHPKAIYDDGTIIGWASTHVIPAQMYVSRNGVIDPKYRIVLEEPNNSSAETLINSIGLVGTQVFYSIEFDRTTIVAGAYGTPPNTRLVPQSKQFIVPEGLTPSGKVSGTAFYTYGRQSVFYGSGSNFITLAPPGAVTEEGGVSNALDEVAGSYVDAGGIPHGFLYYAGSYDSFDMPQPASEIAVTGINDHGRVVGTYTAASNGHKHAFLWNGTTVTSFDNYDNLAAPSVTLNNNGTMLVAVQYFDLFPEQRWSSYLATCSGSGC